MKKKKLKQKFLSRELKKLFCIMKLIFVFLLLSSNLVLGSQTYAQITSLNLNLVSTCHSGATFHYLKVNSLSKKQLQVF